MSSGCHGERLKFSTHRDNLKSLEGLCWQPKCWREPLLPPLAKFGGLPHTCSHALTHTCVHAHTHSRTHACPSPAPAAEGQIKVVASLQQGSCTSKCHSSPFNLPSFPSVLRFRFHRAQRGVYVRVCARVWRARGCLSCMHTGLLFSIGELGLETILASHCGLGLQCPFQRPPGPVQPFLGTTKKTLQSELGPERDLLFFHPSHP